MSSGTFASMGDGDGFEWDPDGVTEGVDFQTDRHFDGATVSSDLTEIFGGTFNPSSVSSLGMAVFDEDASNRPDAAGWLFDKLATLDYTCVVFWRQQTFYPSNKLIQLVNVGSSDGMDVSLSSTGAASEATGWNGDYNSLGAANEFSDNVLAFSTNADGVLGSLNGATAVLSAPAVSFITESIRIGCDKDNNAPLEGWLKAIIFYPKTSVAAEVEAYAAHAAPVNTAAPVISGTPQVGVELSVSNGSWTNSPTSYQYQWYKDIFSQASIIPGATSNTYTPTAGDENAFINCVVSAVNADGIGGKGIFGDSPVASA